MRDDTAVGGGACSKLLLAAQLSGTPKRTRPVPQEMSRPLGRIALVERVDPKLLSLHLRTPDIQSQTWMAVGMSHGMATVESDMGVMAPLGLPLRS